MTLQNRVTPFGTIIRDPARGTVMGNRGILHDEGRELGASRWKSKAWIACTLQFKNRRRTVMSPGSYTELFFLDEATSLAAGHRPCAECRREAFERFRLTFAKGFELDRLPTAGEIDARLHAARIQRVSRRQITHERNLDSLPDGVFVAIDGEPWLVKAREFRRWAPTGYADRIDRPHKTIATVLTPAPTVAALAAGYIPAIHDSGC